MVMVYTNMSVVYRQSEDGLEQFVELDRAIMSVMFFEELMFYSTESSLYLLVLQFDSTEDVLDILLADSNPNALHYTLYDITQE